MFNFTRVPIPPYCDFSFPREVSRDGALEISSAELILNVRFDNLISAYGNNAHVIFLRIETPLPDDGSISFNNHTSYLSVVNEFCIENACQNNFSMRYPR